MYFSDLMKKRLPGSRLMGGSNECLVEACLPQQPSVKLNQRFGIKRFIEIPIVQRNHSRWSISWLHHYIHRDKADVEVTQELMAIDFMGDECRAVFQERSQTIQEKPAAAEKPSEIWKYVRVKGKSLG